MGGQRAACDGVLLRVYGFRSIHLPYKYLPRLLETALQGRPFSDYQYFDGETIGGAILGYNFGDGYLHGRYMAQAVQDICGFEEGEVLHISMDSCPALGDKVPWAVHDIAALFPSTAAIASGSTSLSDLQEMQPY